MLNPIVGLALPAVGVILIATKVPAHWKRQFFRVPIWLSSSAVAWKMGHLFTGVMAPYAMLIMDAVLLPAFWLMKRHHEKKYGPVESISLPKPVTSFFKRIGQKIASLFGIRPALNPG